jgi:hypothetical protein
LDEESAEHAATSAHPAINCQSAENRMSYPIIEGIQTCCAPASSDRLVVSQSTF